MPTYRYNTASCDCAITRECSIAMMEVFEAGTPTCPHGHPLLRDWSIRRSPSFHAGLYEHISPEGPIQVDSMQQLKSLAREHGVYSNYAEDMGSLYRAKEGRWI